jgi:NAD(P)-dependent dehydrogenase (short-subunit alcohol dehydrogenase family)
LSQTGISVLMRDRPVVVITGGSAGVGRATARLFARRGSRLGLIARGRDGLEAAVKEVEEAGSRALGLSADVGDASEIEDAATAVEEEFGPADVWINNAMTAVFAPFLDVSSDEFRRVTDVTYHGYVNGTRAALRRMVPRDHGTVVQVGSALAYRAIPLQSAYCGAKHAIEGFTESVRAELVHEHSRVQIAMCHLPALNTPQFEWVLSRLPRRPSPVPPIYQPEVAARAVVHLACHPRREMWVGGSTVATIVADRLVPTLLDRYLAARGVDSQQTDEPADQSRPVNLWEPVVGDQGGTRRLRGGAQPQLRSLGEPAPAIADRGHGRRGRGAERPHP